MEVTEPAGRDDKFRPFDRGRIMLPRCKPPRPSVPEGIVEGGHFLLVADEVHQIGSPENSKILESMPEPTRIEREPVRYGDPDGTRQIFTTLTESYLRHLRSSTPFELGRLVPYEYYPHPITLTAAEADQWRTISRAIRLEVAARTEGCEKGRGLPTERVKFLLISRARIAKKAAQVEIAREVLRSHYDAGQHWLVYCEDTDQLDEVMAHSGRRAYPIEYHSAMTGIATRLWAGLVVWRPARLYPLPRRGRGYSIVTHALILASSQNPRQFIQRRGRVLRTAPGKHLPSFMTPLLSRHLDDEPEQACFLSPKCPGWLSLRTAPSTKWRAQN